MIGLFLFSFNTQPPEGGWKIQLPPKSLKTSVSTHSRLKAAGAPEVLEYALDAVSTHSRLKAAGGFRPVAAGPLRGFNTQPPEGGWDRPRAGRRDKNGFNTQPPEGGWP